MIPPSAELMPEDQFWQIVHSTFSQAKGNFRDQQEVLKQILRSMPAEDIMLFDNRFRSLRGKAYDWSLWGAIYTIHGGCYEDHFLEFRAWLIAQGRDFYYRTLENPETLVELEPERIDIDWEGMTHIPSEVFLELTGQTLSSAYVENDELQGEEWEEFTNDLQIRFPKLWLKYSKR